MTSGGMGEIVVLLPCPFCGIAYIELSNRYTDNYQAHCMSCGTDGPTSYRLESAIAAWNTRAPIERMG